MSQKTKHTRSNCSILSAWTVAMAAAVIASAPSWTYADEPAKSATQSMTSKHMDHSKMDGMSMTGDVDYDFAANMRKHHQMAIDKSQAELTNGKDPQMLRMARDIIAAQTKEIVVLDQWLEAHKKAMTKAMTKPQ